jgi:hypothetical protein
MSFVDADMLKAFATHVPPDSTIDDNRLAWTKTFQENMDAIIDRFIGQMRHSFSARCRQMPVPQCVTASKEDIEAFRGRLFQRFGVLSAVFTRDIERKVQQDKPTGGYSVTATKETVTEVIRHQCEGEPIHITRMMEWPGEEKKAVCWRVNFLLVEGAQGPAFLQDKAAIVIPLTPVMHQVTDYLKSIALRDEFVGKNPMMYGFWLQRQVEVVVGNSRRELLNKPVWGSSKEVAILCHYLFEMYHVRILATKLSSNESAFQQPFFNLTGELGWFHRGQGSSFYALTQYECSDQSASSQYFQIQGGQ